ncbi:MAG TPA: hypothetical protein VGJ86_09815 [Acidimicrobiales bacterium]|jgi:predicted lipoprotein with Yx(FWY)xxD motif
MPHLRTLGASFLALAALTFVAACGDDDSKQASSSTTERSTTTTTEATTEPSTTTSQAPPSASAATVQSADIAVGSVLVDANGHTLYAFMNDSAGTPTCGGSCAGAWPPLLVEGELMLGPGLDTALFTTVPGVDGGLQVKAGDHPLYRFSGDSAPGDATGQGLGGVWFAVKPDGSLLQES